MVSVQDQSLAADLASLLASPNRTKIVSGIAGAQEVAAASQADLVVSAMVGAVGLEPTLTAIRQGIAVALANKETLVTAGPLVMAAAREQQVPIIPIDSEHSAIFQAIQGNHPEDIRCLWITASGGPFLRKTTRGVGQSYCRGSSAASKLEYGTENNHRFRHLNE